MRKKKEIVFANIFNSQLKVGDRVKVIQIICVAGEDTKAVTDCCLGKEGIIRNVSLDAEFPYEIQFQRIFNFKREELLLISRGN